MRDSETKRSPSRPQSGKISSSVPGRGQKSAANPLLSAQSKMGNQALSRLLEVRAGKAQENAPGDLARTGAELRQALAQAGGSRGLKIGTPGDAHEREADRAADVPARGAASSSGNTGGESPHGGEAMSRNERSRHERRFAHDFGKVRIHSDAKAARMADALNAEAFTVGRDIYFGAGKRRPGDKDADRLLAHELAHVVQQSRTGPALQPKLKFTGTADHIARVVTVLNSGLGGFYYCSVDKSGELKMDPVRAAHTSSATGPSTQQKFLAEHLWSMISESGTTTVGVVAGGVPIVGSYSLSDIDIADIEKLGIDQPGWDSRAALLHELVEQRQKQLATNKSESDYGSATTGAHSKGLAAELGFIGATIESDSNLVGASQNADGTMNGHRTVVFKYPDGTRYSVEVTLTSNNITAVKRTKLP